MKKFQGVRRIFTADCHVDASPDAVFPQLCPTREYDWIRQWDCELVYSRSGYAELDGVFTTSFPNEENDTWVISRFEPPERIEFVRVNPDRAMRYIVFVTPSADTTRITWTQFITGLNEAGNRVVEKLSLKAYKEMIDAAGKMLTHYLGTGEQMKIDVFEEMKK